MEEVTRVCPRVQVSQPTLPTRTECCPPPPTMSWLPWLPWPQLQQLNPTLLHQTWPHCSSVQSALTMCCPPSCSVMQATWSAATAGPSSPAVPPAEVSWGATSGTWPWRRWPQQSCFPASTAAEAVVSHYYTQRRFDQKYFTTQIKKMFVQIEHEETCEFRPYSCPCPGASCKWQGSLEQVQSI